MPRDVSEIPEITEIDELQTFVGRKKNKVWLSTVVNHWKSGIILWTLGDAFGVTAHSRHRHAKHDFEAVASVSVIAVALVFKFYGQQSNLGVVFPKGYRFAYGMSPTARRSILVLLNLKII